MKSHCNTCGGNREHKLLHEHKKSGTDEIERDFFIQWGATYSLVECAGCGEVTLREESWNSECQDEYGNLDISTRYFPPRVFRSKPRWLTSGEIHLHCPDQVRRLLSEIYICLQNDCVSAAAMSVRALFEFIMVDRNGDKGSFTSNLKEFETTGDISSKQREVVATVLEVGHASIHRGYVPKPEDLVLVVDVIETIVSMVYVQPANADRIKTSIPQRKKP